MKKSTAIGGASILVVLTLIIAAGYFLLLRYNGIRSAELNIQDQARVVDESQNSLEEKVRELKTLTQDQIGETSAFEDTDSVRSALVDNSIVFIREEKEYGDAVTDLLTEVQESGFYSDSEAVNAVLGAIGGLRETLDDAKRSYNDRIDAYDQKRNATPQFVGSLLGFEEYKAFTNLSKPIESGSFDNVNTL